MDDTSPRETPRIRSAASLRFCGEGWGDFLASVSDGEFDHRRPTATAWTPLPPITSTTRSSSRVSTRHRRKLVTQALTPTRPAQLKGGWSRHRSQRGFGIACPNITMRAHPGRHGARVRRSRHRLCGDQAYSSIQRRREPDDRRPVGPTTCARFELTRRVCRLRCSRRKGINMAEADSPLAWRKASRCESGTCVEVALAGGQIAIRDSKQPDGSPYLTFAPETWRGFIASVRAGEFDLP